MPNMAAGVTCKGQSLNAGPGETLPGAPQDLFLHIDRILSRGAAGNLTDQFDATLLRTGHSFVINAASKRRDASCPSPDSVPCGAESIEVRTFNQHVDGRCEISESSPPIMPAIATGRSASANHQHLAGEFTLDTVQCFELLTLPSTPDNDAPFRKPVEIKA